METLGGIRQEWLHEDLKSEHHVVFLSCTSNHNRELQQLDLENTSLNNKLEHEMYMKIPPEGMKKKIRDV